MSDIELAMTPEELAVVSPEPAPAASPPAPEPPPAAPVAPVAPEPAPRVPPGFVPVSTLIELRRELAEVRRQVAPKPAEPQVPSLNDDPATNLDHRVRQAEEAIKGVTESTRAQAAVNQVLTAYRSDAARARAEDSDFDDAYQHWRNRVGDYIEAMNPGADRENALNQHELQIAYTALQAGRSPADAIREMSKRLGWAAKPKETPPAAPKADPAAEIARLARAQAQATSPLAGTGATPAPELTPETLLAMSDDELAALSPSKWRRTWGE